MLRETLPLLGHLPRKLIGVILIAVTLGYISGAVVALKSEIEAGVIEQVDLALKGEEERVFRGELQRFSDADAVLELPFPLQSLELSGITLLPALGIYAFVACVGVAIPVVITSLRMKAKQSIYSELLAHGLRRGLLAEQQERPELQNLPGHLASAIQLGANTISTTYSYAVEGLQHIITLAVAIAAIRQQTNLWFGAAVLAMVIAQALLSVMRARRLRAKRNDLDARRNGLWAKIDDALAMRDVLVSYEQQNRYTERLRNLTSDYVAVERSLNSSEARYQSATSLVMDAGRILILLIGLLLLSGVAPDPISGVGDAYFLISIYTRLLIPTTELLSQFDSFKRSESEAATYLSLVSQSQIPSEAASEARAWPPSHRDIVGVAFREVDLRYPGREDYALRECTFTLPANQTTLVLGRSGFGKTTIARVLLGFIQPEKGTVEIWNTPIQEIPGETLRRQMSYLSQEHHVIDDSIRENLSWGLSKDGVSADRMIAALDRVGISGVDLDASAKRLSTGQQQRIALARMMLDESEILILDEPLTGSDHFTFRDLMEPLRELLTDSTRTIVIFSHRLSYAAWTNHVIVMGRKGRVTEEGAPSELLNSCGTFAKLYAAAHREIELQDKR